MSSYTRPILKTLSVGAAVSALLICTAHATDPPPRGFVMTVYSDGAGAESLLEGEYENAIREIGPDKYARDLSPSMVSTNLCVAQVKAGQLTAARAACDTAILDAKAEKVSMTTWIPGARARQNDYIAAAYANRAVLHWLSKDVVSAAEDLAAAKRLAPKADFVARNIAALDSSANTMAQIRLAQ